MIPTDMHRALTPLMSRVYRHGDRSGDRYTRIAGAYAAAAEYARAMDAGLRDRLVGTDAAEPGLVDDGLRALWLERAGQWAEAAAFYTREGEYRRALTAEGPAPAGS